MALALQDQQAPPSTSTSSTNTKGCIQCYPTDAGLSPPGQRAINIEKSCWPTSKGPLFVSWVCPHQLLWLSPDGIPWALGQEYDAAGLAHWSRDTVGLAVCLPHTSLRMSGGGRSGDRKALNLGLFSGSGMWDGERCVSWRPEDSSGRGKLLCLQSYDVKEHLH